MPWVMDKYQRKGKIHMIGEGERRKRRRKSKHKKKKEKEKTMKEANKDREADK